MTPLTGSRGRDVHVRALLWSMRLTQDMLIISRQLHSAAEHPEGFGHQAALRALDRLLVELPALRDDLAVYGPYPISREEM
jgi:hypothetical protein